MTNAEEGYKKFIGAYIKLTAPKLGMRYDPDITTLYYLYASQKHSIVKLIRISTDYDEILDFFDLDTLSDRDIKDLAQEDFNFGILYSNFFNSKVITFPAMRDLGVASPLVRSFCSQRWKDALMSNDSENYRFVINDNINIGMVEDSFPKCKLRKEVDDIIFTRSELYDDKLLTYPNVIKWIPKCKEQNMEVVLGTIDAHVRYIKDVYNCSLKEYTNKNELETIIKNFKNYIYDFKFVK